MTFSLAHDHVTLESDISSDNQLIVDMASIDVNVFTELDLSIDVAEVNGDDATVCKRFVEVHEKVAERSKSGRSEFILEQCNDTESERMWC